MPQILMYGDHLRGRRGRRRRDVFGLLTRDVSACIPRYCMPQIHASNPCYFMPQTLMYDRY